MACGIPNVNRKCKILIHSAHHDNQDGTFAPFTSFIAAPLRTKEAAAKTSAIRDIRSVAMLMVNLSLVKVGPCHAYFGGTLGQALF